MYKECNFLPVLVKPLTNSTLGSSPCLCRLRHSLQVPEILNVVYVRSFTDIDDVIRRAKEIGEDDDPVALSGRFSREFLRDNTDDIQCLPPTHQPRVTQHMEQIVDMIAKIMTNGCAYTIDGDVCFSVHIFPEYVRGLSTGRKLEDNIAGKRVIADLRKRNPADFVLWKAAKPGEDGVGILNAVQ